MDDFYQQRAEDKLPTSDNPENDAVVAKSLRALQLKPGDRLLDFGCADGYFLSRLARAQPGIEAHGVDLVAHAAWDALPLISFRAGDIPLPFPDGYFDAIFSSQVLEHLLNPVLAAAELSRVLKPGGRIWVATPNSYDDTWVGFHRFQRQVDRVEGHFRHFSAGDLGRLFGAHGCAVVAVRYDLFLGLYIYYRFVSYNPLLKRWLLRVVAPEVAEGNCRRGHVAQARPGRQSLAKVMAFAVLRALRWFDEFFSSSPKCQVVEVTLIKMP